MFAILGLVLFIIGWFEHGARVTGMPAWFDTTGLMLLGLACIAAHGFWPLWRRPPG